MGSVLPQRGGRIPGRKEPPEESSHKMARRQTQRKSLQAHHTSHENNEKKLQHRRTHRSQAGLSKHNHCPHSTQGFVASEDRMEPPALDRKCAGLTGSRGSSSRRCLSDSTPDLLQRRSPNPELGRPSVLSDSDTDLSESERLPVSSTCGRVPPQLELRPDVPESFQDVPSRGPRRGRSFGSAFPDFLPPPFNSWSLGQLAVFYNTEGAGASPRPWRPVGCLERYLDRLLQLEWLQIQTFQEESGRSEVTSGGHRSHSAAATASSRLSSPKCILQCQRSFPLTLLSSLASQCTLLSGCACAPGRIRPPACSRTSNRLSPTPERRGGAMPLPRRSYSESRVHPSHRSTASQASSHLRRMQASGNLRNPPPDETSKPDSASRNAGGGGGGGGGGEALLDHRTGGSRKRSDSEQRRRGGGGERWEKRRSGSECRRAGAERRRTEIKPDAGTAIKDHLPGSKSSRVIRSNSTKHVEFVT